MKSSKGDKKKWQEINKHNEKLGEAEEQGRTVTVESTTNKGRQRITTTGMPKNRVLKEKGHYDHGGSVDIVGTDGMAPLEFYDITKITVHEPATAPENTA